MNLWRDITHEIVVRWSDPEPRHVALLREGGVTAVIAPPHQGFEKACVDAGIRSIPAGQVRLLDLRDAGTARAGEVALVKAGLWPGVHRPDPTVAGASRSTWMDQNCYLVNWLRALHPRQPTLLGYLPDKSAGVQPDRVFRFDSLELALAEAFVSGGNYAMALEPRLRDALEKGGTDAVDAWRRLGRTAKWLRANAPLFRQPALPLVTLLVDASDTSIEIANLCYRFNVSPALAAADNPPVPDPRNRLVLVAAGIAAPKGDARRRILAHALAGATVVVEGLEANAWWRTAGMQPRHTDPDREFFAAGRGQVVAYKEPVTDPGEFALDLIDIISQKRRAARLWNCDAGVALATLAPRAGEVTGQAALHIINYGQPVDFPVLARIQGAFTRATVVRPEAAPLAVKVARRGSGSEVAVPRLERVATVVFN